MIDPSKADTLLKQYKAIIFPEDRFDDIRYQKKAQDMFEKMRKINMTGFVV